ncbi:MAG: ATP-dependent Clp protease adaptor ClpS [Bacteroidota bacterium]|nr:ATP-dependent Clp protease adaptor ClpS [Bacteroidota bacterium]
MVRKNHEKNDYSESLNRGNDKFLILHNDDVHDFEYVIDSLIDVCNHNNIQAEQCAYLVHYSGKCDIKKGDYSDLSKMKEELEIKGLEVSLT